jgi:hypothetical protein
MNLKAKTGYDGFVLHRNRNLSHCAPSTPIQVKGKNADPFGTHARKRALVS